MPKVLEKEAKVEVKEVNPMVMVVGEEVDLKEILKEVKSLREEIKNLKFMIQTYNQMRGK